MPKLKIEKEGVYSFRCPGCDDIHELPVIGSPNYPNRFHWHFNGDIQSPTFMPSLLMKSGHFAYDKPEPSCWCTYNADKIAKGEDTLNISCYICHSWVVNGVIVFLSDCTHKLAGVTMELPEIVESLP